MADLSSYWYFEQVDLYDMLCPHKSPALLEKHTFHKFNKDDFIYFPSDTSSHIYMISEGRVKIGNKTPDGKDIVKAILGKGEIFGEMALMGEEQRVDYAQAMDGSTTVCPMTIADVEEMIRENDSLSLKLNKIIGLRLRKVERRLESLVFKDARTRIVEFLVELAHEKGQKVGFETMVRNHFTHKDIASLTGTSRQTVTTVMNELKDQNIITFDRRRILIRDIEKLT